RRGRRRLGLPGRPLGLIMTGDGLAGRDTHAGRPDQGEDGGRGRGGGDEGRSALGDGRTEDRPRAAGPPGAVGLPAGGAVALRQRPEGPVVVADESRVEPGLGGAGGGEDAPPAVEVAGGQGVAGGAGEG